MADSKSDQTPSALRVISGGRDGEQITRYEERTYDERAEQALLAYLFQEPESLCEIAFLLPEHFRSEAHRQVYVSFRSLESSGRAIDIVSVCSELKSSGRLSQVGGMAYITELQNAVPCLGVRHLVTFATTIRNLSVRRSMFAFAIGLRSRVEVDEADEASLLAWANENLTRMTSELGSSEKNDHVSEVKERLIADITTMLRTPGHARRTCGFDSLDELLAGLHDELLVIGARPGMGKTALGCAMAAHIATTTGGVYIASLETNQKTLLLRMACAIERISLHRARAGRLDVNEDIRLMKAIQTLGALPIWIDDTPAQSVLELWAKCKRSHLQLARAGSKLAAVVVDYVQLLRAPRPNMKREEVVSENLRALKAMGQDLSVTVIGLAQLSREVEKRADKRPQLSDLRESGEIEQCARTVLLLYRADYYARRDRDFCPDGEVEVNIAKQNNGPTAIVTLTFDEVSTNFSDPRDTT